MVRKRPSRRCLTCRRPTKSVTSFCADCRPADAIPLVSVVGGGLSFAGLTLTLTQARHLADTLHDAVDHQELQP